MAEIVVLGGGMVGLSTAMLLACEGCSVTVLEQDPADPADDAAGSWAGWARDGVAQFRMGHYFQPRLTTELRAELPDVVRGLERFGALRYNQIEHAAPLTGATPRDDDDRFDGYTARRPVMEAVFASAASATSGVVVRRGVVVESFVASDRHRPGGSSTPHVVGVRTTDGEEIRADLVVDAGGRRSRVVQFLADAGAAAPREHVEDFGFTYYGLHFRGDELPAMRSSLLTAYGSVAVLTLPADHDTYMVGFVTLAGDRPMSALRDLDTWRRVLDRCEAVAHWGAGTPIDDGVKVMARNEDRRRDFVVDGRPVATGVVAVGDAWACSNPSIGRGATIGFLHALALRDALVDVGVDDPLGVALAFDERTTAGVRPWVDATMAVDRGRAEAIRAEIDGRPWEPKGPVGEIAAALQHASLLDGELHRAMTEIGGMLAPAEDVVSRPGLIDRVVEVGAGWREAPRRGPTRAELLELVGA